MAWEYWHSYERFRLFGFTDLGLIGQAFEGAEWFVSLETGQLLAWSSLF